MNMMNTLNRLIVRLRSTRNRTFIAAGIALFLSSTASGATIGLKLGVNGNGGVQTGFLLPTDLAGAPGYQQTNWITLGRWGDNVTAQFNVVDSAGANTGIIINWDATGNWSQSGGATPADTFTPDGNLLSPYCDSGGAANLALGTTIFGNSGNNKPLVYLSGIATWLATQSATNYDIVLYVDGDQNQGRTGEYWIQAASGVPTSALVFGADLTTHAFICDRANFITTAAYAQVPLASLCSWSDVPPEIGGGNSGWGAVLGNTPGNFVVFRNLSADSFLLRTEDFRAAGGTLRSPVNAIQIVPSTVVEPVTIAPLPANRVYAGGTAKFRAQVGGLASSYQWQRAGTNLVDGGNISGSTTATLTLGNVSAADAANYQLIVSNSVAVVSSGVAPLTLVVPAPNSYAEKIATNGVYAYWRLNETEDPSTNHAPAYDYVGGFNGVYGLAAQNSTIGIAGPQPPSFPGFENGNFALQSANGTIRSWVVAPPLALNTNTVTMCAWIYPTIPNMPASTAILFSRTTNNDVCGFGYGANNTIGYTWNNAAGFVSLLPIPSNQWSFVACVVTPSNATLYVQNTNGQLSAVNQAAHAVASFRGFTCIGDDPSSANTPQGRAFTGLIDEVAVFNRSLSPAEIGDLYKKGLQITAIPPVIPAQPVPLALLEGRTARFAVTASGEAPLTYQWRTNGVNLGNGGNVSGATSPNLTITGVTLANAGNYDVVVGNTINSIASSIASLTVVASNAAAPYEARLRAANPIAYWRLNEASGSASSYDYWGGNILANTGVALGAPGPVPPEYSGIESTNTGGLFDGTTSFSAASPSLMNNLAQFSVIGWFNIPAAIFTARLGLFGQNDVVEFGFHGNGTDLVPQVGIFTPRGSAFLNQSTNVLPGVWYLIAAVGTGTNVNLYLASTNGSGGVKIMQSTSAANVTTNYGAAPFPFRIGGGGILDATGNFFPGTIDEVAVFDRAISGDELSGLFGAALSGGDLPPTISADPVSQTLYAGRTAIFAVTALGSSPKYQWRTNGVPVPNHGNLSGATTATLTITNVSALNQAIYDVVITNGTGIVTSAPATLIVITPVPNSYESAVIALNPIAYYRLNETNDPSGGTAIANDFWGGLNGSYGVASQNGFTPIAGPRPVDSFSIFEIDNTALMSSGADSWVTTPALGVTTNAITMTAWINPLAIVDRAGIVFARAGQAATGLNFISTNNLNYHWLDNAATYNWDSGLNVPLNQWSFVALVVEPTQGTVYLINTNGSQSAVNVVANAVRTFSDTIRIGGDPNAAARTVNGSIDEVAIFPYALSASQIQSLYSAAPAVSLSVRQSGGNIILTWPQGALLEANEVTGPYTTNSAASPYTNSPTAPRKFYKVIVQ